MEITQELVKELFDYHEDGYLIWKVDVGSNKVKGLKAGCLNMSGYVRVLINKRGYPLHRLIFLYHHGWLPEIVDHKDLNELNNRIENLRATTKSQNCKNKRSAKNSSSKYLGVHLHMKRSWVVQIKVNGVHLHGGSFKNENEAALHYNKLAVKHHGEFANLNIIQL